MTYLQTIQKNKELCTKYPFLIPKNRFSGKVSEDYDYSYTELDAMPEGWLKAFGMQMVEELNEALGDYAKEYFITQIKEKYGTLRWYDSGCTGEGHKVINKYAQLSAVTCIVCGEKATKISDGWISPYCDSCYKGRKPLYLIKDGKIMYDESQYEE